MTSRTPATSIAGDSLPTASPAHASITIQFVHAAPTPHNNHLLDTVAAVPGVTLYRHYLLAPTAVPGRPWKGMSSGEVQVERIHAGYDTRFDWRLLKLALTDRRSAFFVIGWDYPVLVILLLVLGLRRRPLVMWDDGPSEESLALFRQFWRPKQLLKRMLIALINRTPGTYFHTGEITRQDILSLGVAARKLQPLPFFVKPGQRRQALRDTHRCTGSTALVLAGGRLTVEKGYDVLVEALGLLKRMGGAPWRAVLIGSGPEKDRLHALVDRLGLVDDIDFVPWAEPEVFADYIHSCDIFAAPARFDHFPTTVIAAMQAGAVVVATEAVGSAVEFIESERSGLLIPLNEPEAMARHLARVIADTEFRQRLASAALDTIRQWPVERGARLIVNAAEDALRTCAD